MDIAALMQPLAGLNGFNMGFTQGSAFRATLG